MFLKVKYRCQPIIRLKTIKYKNNIFYYLFLYICSIFITQDFYKPVCLYL